MLSDFKCSCPVYLACGYTDLRRGIDGLAGLVQTQFHQDPFQNALFLFCGRRKDRLKGLYWEGDGFVLVYKRLESGSFQWPRNGEEARQLTPQQYRWLIEQLRLLKKKQSGSVKDVAPDNIPVEVVEHRLSDEERVYPQCGELMREIGTEARETLKLIPAKAILRRDIYYTYACENCEKNDVSTPIVKTPKEPPVIPGSYVSPEAIAHNQIGAQRSGSDLERRGKEAG